jgi:xanthine phosphoribosyltransferase
MSTSAPIYYLTWEELHRDSRALAAALIAHGGNWQGIIGIARGGLIPAAIIGRELNIRLIDSLCIASYNHDRQGDATILKSIEGNGTGWLIIDDLVDTGNTAKLVRQILPKATLATVYAKPKGKELADIYVREFEQNVWIHFPWDSQYSYSEPLVTGRDLVP